jgi:TP901 family phage tail tape measure protein
MADNIESRIDLNIDVSSALASIKTLQAQISAFHQSIRNSGNAVNQAVSDQLTRNLLNSINATKQFSASLTTVKDSSQAFTSALERNKLSLGEYFKFGAASTQTFGRVFKNEFNTIEKVARERVKTLQTQYIRMGRDANGALEAIRVRPLRLDMEQLGTQVAMTAQKQQLFNQLLKQGSTNLLNFGKNTQWAGRQLMVGFTIPLSILGSMAIKEFEKIEKQAIRFRRVYGDTFSTTEETDAALRNMRELATEFTKYGIEVNKTLELAADAAQMGLTGAELRAQVTEATRLAVLGEVEQQQALEATISVTNAFGIAADDLAKKIDFLNAVENQTVTSIQDLTIAIPKAGPVVQQLGGNVEDLAFFLTAMREGGINASEGANALKSGLSKIINPTEKATQMLAGFGINLKGIVEANKGDIKGTVLALANAFDTLDPLNRARAIEQLFGTFQFARLSTLFQNVTKEAGQAQRVLELSNASAQELAILSERELKKVEESPLFKLQKAIERLQESLAPLGVEFMKIITPLIEFGTDVLKKFNEMDAGAKQFVTGVVTVLGLIAPVAIMTFGLLANGIANFVKGINFVRTLFGKLAGAGTGLNQMTQYMTMEQLEATAAASSLGQAHSQLTTIFTAENAALSNLTIAYNNAIAAINRYNAASAQTRARPGTQAQGFASGILSVPGPKGKGDIIPAMLSPGEAVIPAEEAEKYRSLIAGIISDNIPGFVLGTPNVAQSYTERYANYQPRGERRTVIASQSMIENVAPGRGAEVVRKVAESGVGAKDATAIISDAATQAQRGVQELEAFIQALDSALADARRNSQGLVARSDELKRSIRSRAGIIPTSVGAKAFAHIGSGTEMSREDLIAMMESGQLKPPPDQARGIIAQPSGSMIDVKTGLGLGNFNQEINRQLDTRTGAKIEDFASAFDEAGIEKWNQSIKFGGGNVEQLSASVGILDQKFKQLIAAVPAGTTAFDRQQQALEFQQRTGQNAVSVEALYAEARRQSAGDAGDLVSVLDIAQATPTETRPGGRSSGPGKRRVLGDPLLQLQEAARVEQNIAFDAGVQDAKAVKNGMKTVLGDGQSDPFVLATPLRNSPHPDAGKSGLEDGRAYAINFNAGIGEGQLPPPLPSSSRPAGGQPPRLGAPPIPGFEQSSLPSYSTIPPTQRSGFGGIKDVIANKAKQAFEKGVAGLEKSFMTGALGEIGPLKNLKETIVANAEMDARIAGGSGVQLTDIQGNIIASIDVQNKTRKQLLEEERQNLRTSQSQIDQQEALLTQQQAVTAQESQNLDQQQAIVNQPMTRREARQLERAKDRKDRQLDKQAAAQRRSARAGRAFGALSSVSMVAGLASGVEGPVGQIAQQVLPVAGALSAIAPILLALPTPLALLAAGVGIAAFAFAKWNEMIDGARKEGTKLANALTMTTDKLIKLSEATGKVSATEERRRKEEDQLAGADGKARKFGQTFLESEAGKAFLADIGTITSVGGSKTEAAEATGAQLGMMIAQGIISSGEATSIAAAIGTELNDYNFAAQITGNLIALVGPNGEDLTKDPLKVMLAIQEQSIQNLKDISTTALSQEEIDKNVEQRILKQREEAKQERDIRFARGGMEGFGAGIEGMFADILSNAATGGAAWTALTGAKKGTISDTDPEFLIEKAKESAKLQSASIQLGINQIQQNQQLLDSLEKQYDSKIKQKEAEIAATSSTEKKARLEKELDQLYKNRNRDVDTLNQSNAKTMNQLTSMKKDFDSTVYGEAIKTSVLSQFGEDNPLRVLAEDTVNRLNELKDSRFKTEIQLQFASGELSIDAVNALLEAEKLNPSIRSTFSFVVDKRGSAAGGQLLDLMAKAGLSSAGINQYMNLFAQIKTDEEFDDTTEALSQIANMQQEYGFKIDLELPDGKQTLKDVTRMVNIVKDMPKEMTRDQTIKFNKELNDPNLDAIIKNWDQIFGKGMKGSTEVFVEFTAAGNADDVQAYMVDQLGMQPATMARAIERMQTDPKYKRAMEDAAAAWRVEQGNKNLNLNTGGDGEGDGDKGAGKENPLDALLRRLKLVRDASINASGGLKTLREVMKSGTKATSQFLGIEQKLLDQGVSKRFIDELMSMDEEFRKQYLKGEKSGVVQLTEDGERLSQLLNELTLGDYNISISSNLQEVNAQITAMTKLTQQGVSVAEASEIVQDKTLALAIAFDTTGTEVTRLVDELKKLREAEKKLMLTTPEGRVKEFQSVAAEANAYFAAQEEQLNLQYEAGVKAYEIQNGIIEAQRQVADMEFNLDDLQYALDQIAQQEEKINEEYDKREEAIESIFKANKAILDQDKEKLDIAGALASGDLAAAAKAMRAQTVANLERNKELQLDNLQRSRELELSQVRTKSGQSRLDLEKQIRDVEKQIAEIQESKLEPYQREVDLLDRIRQDALRDVQENGFLGQTQSRWNQIANEVERAKFGVAGYMDELKNRLAAIPGIKFNADGTISVDAAQLQTPEVNPAPTGQTNTNNANNTNNTNNVNNTNTEMSEKDKQIAELNRRIAITRWRVRNEKDRLTATEINNLMALNQKRIKEVVRLGGVVTGDMIDPATSNTAITKLAPGFAGGGMIAKRFGMGGKVKYYPMGGLIPYKAEGGSIFKSLGSDTVPAMLTPGEFVVRRQAVRNFGVDRLSAINNGAYSGDSVYNYEVNVNVKSDANPDEIARSVMAQIKRVESQRLRSNRF